ncbi:hypothetical protein ESP51_13620, partial [Agromyces albus]
MTDTTNGATGEPRDGDVPETRAASESAAPEQQEPATAPAATGTVYEPGQEPQPYSAPHHESSASAQAPAAPAAPASPTAPSGSAPAPG